MVLKQIQCPPEGKKNNGIPLLFNKWIPSMEKYAGDYLGLGDITGSTSNKEAKKVAIGINRFVSTDDKCDNTSDVDCIGKDKYMYMRSYPLGYVPICKEEIEIIDSIGKKKYEHTGNIDLIGGTGLIGNLQEDIINLPISDYMDAIANKSGPFHSKKCMKARLPVGDGIAVDGRKFLTKEEVDNNGRGWYIDEKCIPKEPTLNKTYGGEIFKIPFSKSKCVKEAEVKENFKMEHINYFYKYAFAIIALFILLAILKGTSYTKYTKYSKYIFLIICSVSIMFICY